MNKEIKREEFINEMLPIFAELKNHQTKWKKFIDGLNLLLNNWISVELNNCADKIREETFCENREEDNLIDHVVNEIRKFKSLKGVNMKKAKVTQVTLTLRQGSDGHWLGFKSKKGNESIINLENHFMNKGIIANSIIEWAKEQFPKLSKE